MLVLPIRRFEASQIAFQYLRAYGQCSSLKQLIRVQGIVCSTDILLTSFSLRQEGGGAIVADLVVCIENFCT
ncbi:hypothetical protein [Paenibacillus riograndensis]|nr:hypothetical protein [Paenibacillus riograndensis]